MNSKQDKQPKTLAAITKTLRACNGRDETAAVLWGENDGGTSASAFIGDSDVLASTLTCVLNNVGEGRATQAEMAITRAVLLAVVTADTLHHGQLQESIDNYRRQMAAGTLKVKYCGEPIEPI